MRCPSFVYLMVVGRNHLCCYSYQLAFIQHLVFSNAESFKNSMSNYAPVVVVAAAAGGQIEVNGITNLPGTNVAFT
jgi:hypothetical protein